MKTIKHFFILSIFLATAFFANAQKVGIVDTEYILSQMPQYVDADNRLSAQIATWEQELVNMQSEYDKKKSAFENEKVLLIGDQLKLREKEVLDLERNIRSTQSLRFNTNGEIEKLRASMVAPFQDQIYNAVKTVRDKFGLGIVIDKSDKTSVIMLEKRYDYSDKVLDVLLRGGVSKEKEKANKKK